jgi:hypothetical protein
MSADGPKAKFVDVRRQVGFQGDSGLIVLKVSFVVRDPCATCTVQNFRSAN